MDTNEEPWVQEPSLSQLPMRVGFFKVTKAFNLVSIEWTFFLQSYFIDFLNDISWNYETVSVDETYNQV